MPQAAVLLETTGTVAVVTLNRGDNRNSMTPELLESFAQTIATVRTMPNVRAVVITGKGRCFSAGADFRSQIQVEGGENEKARVAHERSFAMYEPFLSVGDLEVPVVGALNGHAVGGGFGLALMCDLRIANSGAKYGANFTRLGLHPGMAISYLLPRLIGVAQAADLLFTGRLIKGDEAAAMGLVNQAVEAEAVLPRAMELAHSIAANAPVAMRMTKRSLYQGLDWRARDAAYAEAYAQAATLETQDSKEGMQALLQKREPSFEGR